MGAISSGWLRPFASDKWGPWVLVSEEKSLEISLDSEEHHTYSECNGVALSTT